MLEDADSAEQGIQQSTSGEEWSGHKKTALVRGGLGFGLICVVAYQQPVENAATKSR